MLGVLLDTNALIWWLKADFNKKRSIKIETLLRDSSHRKFISSISTAEIAIKFSLGKLPEADPVILGQVLADKPITHLPYQSHHSLTLAKLPWHHRDPFDRMLVAQAMTDHLTIITSDSIFKSYDIPVMMLE